MTIFGLPGFPLDGCSDSRLSDVSPVGNGGTVGKLSGLFFLGEGPVFAFAFGLLSGVCSFLWSALCSGREAPVFAFWFQLYYMM